MASCFGNRVLWEPKGINVRPGNRYKSDASLDKDFWMTSASSVWNPSSKVRSKSCSVSTRPWSCCDSGQWRVKATFFMRGSSFFGVGTSCLVVLMANQKENPPFWRTLKETHMRHMPIYGTHFQADPFGVIGHNYNQVVWRQGFLAYSGPKKNPS